MEVSSAFWTFVDLVMNYNDNANEDGMTIEASKAHQEMVDIVAKLDALLPYSTCIAFDEARHTLEKDALVGADVYYDAVSNTFRFRDINALFYQMHYILRRPEDRERVKCCIDRVHNILDIRDIMSQINNVALE